MAAISSSVQPMKELELGSSNAYSKSITKNPALVPPMYKSAIISSLIIHNINQKITILKRS